MTPSAWRSLPDSDEFTRNTPDLPIRPGNRSASVSPASIYVRGRSFRLEQPASSLR